MKNIDLINEDDVTFMSSTGSKQLVKRYEEDSAFSEVVEDFRKSEGHFKKSKPLPSHAYNQSSSVGSS